MDDSWISWSQRDQELYKLNYEYDSSFQSNTVILQQDYYYWSRHIFASERLVPVGVENERHFSSSTTSFKTSETPHKLFLRIPEIKDTHHSILILES